jgi:hypothetical protein
MGPRRKSSVIDHLARDLTKWIKKATRRTALVAQSNVADLTDDAVDIFWISVYGIAVDLRERLRRMNSVDLAKSLGLSEDLGEESGPTACLATMQVLHDALTDAEWLYVARARNVAAHPSLDDYGIAIQGDRLIDERNRKVVGRSVIVEEEDNAIDRVLAEHGGTDGGVAVHIASKISTAMRDVENSFSTWWLCEELVGA